MSYNRKQEIVQIAVEKIKPYPGNPRINEQAVPALMENIRKMGFRNPLYLAPDLTIVAGHTRLKAARALGMTEVDCIIVSDLTEAEMREMRLSDNRLSEFAKWDLGLLSEEIEWLEDDGADLEYLEIDELIDLDEGVAGTLFDIHPGDVMQIERTIYDSFELTLVLPLEHKEMIHSWIKEHSKDELSMILIDAIKEGSQ